MLVCETRSLHNDESSAKAAKEELLFATGSKISHNLPVI